MLRHYIILYVYDSWTWMFLVSSQLATRQQRQNNWKTVATITSVRTRWDALSWDGCRSCAWIGGNMATMLMCRDSNMTVHTWEPCLKNWFPYVRLVFLLYFFLVFDLKTEQNSRMDTCQSNEINTSPASYRVYDYTYYMGYVWHTAGIWPWAGKNCLD